MTMLEYTEQGWRKMIDRKRHHRERHWDYRGRGIYHFTLTTCERYPLFGQLAGESQEEAFVELNEFGKAVLAIMQNLPCFYAAKGYAIKILASQIMSDHIHLVLQVLEPLPQSVGYVIRGFKSTCTATYKRMYITGDNNVAEVHNESKENSIVHFARIFASSNSIWEAIPSRYHERILHKDGQLQHMIDYVHDNPRRLAIKRANPDLFRIKQENRIGKTPCLALGNIFLLDNPQKEVLKCSRSMSPVEIKQKKQECLREAANGTVFVSGAISEGEKQICRALREAGHRLIILLTNGFPEPDSPQYKYYKPQGLYFKACTAGNLLLVQPDKAVLERRDVLERVTAKVGDIPHDSKRYQFVAMNIVAEDIAELSCSRS